MEINVVLKGRVKYMQDFGFHERDFGDGTIATTPEASHTYAAPGTYVIKASATDDDGATTSATREIVLE